MPTATVTTACTVGAAVLSFLGTALNPQVYQDMTFFQPSVVIDSPTDGQVLAGKFAINGQISHANKSETLWSFLHPTDGTTYFPNAGPCVIDDQDKWGCPDFVLGPFDPNAPSLEVVVVRADARAIAEIFAYERNRPRDEYPGMDHLPGSSPTSRRIVQRQS